MFNHGIHGKHGKRRLWFPCVRRVPWLDSWQVTEDRPWVFVFRDHYGVYVRSNRVATILAVFSSRTVEWAPLGIARISPN